MNLEVTQKGPKPKLASQVQQITLTARTRDEKILLAQMLLVIKDGGVIRAETEETFCELVFDGDKDAKAESKSGSVKTRVPTRKNNRRTTKP